MTKTTLAWHRRALTWLLLSGACPPFLARRIHAAVRRDPAWTAAYDVVRRAERAGTGRALSPGQTDLIEALVLDAVAHDAAHAADAPVRAPLFAPLAAACAAVVLFVVSPVVDFAEPSVGSSTADQSIGRKRPSIVVDNGDHGDKGGDRAGVYTARGDAKAPRVGVRARCIDAAARRLVDQAEAGPATPGDSLRCPRGALLSLSLTNLEDADVYAFSVGVADDGALRFFSPFDEDSASVKVEAGTVDRPLDVVADTGALPDDGGVALFTLFSDRPLRGKDVARTLRDLSQRTGPVRSLDRLPFDALTTRIELTTK